MAVVTMRELLEAGIHFGHQTRRWHPKMSRYIFAERNGIYIIDLQKTMRQLHKAYICVRDAVANGGDVLFVGTKKQGREAVEREATRSGMYYVNNRWLGGTLTNWKTIQKSIAKLLELEEMDADGKLDVYSKKEVISMRKQVAKLDKNLCGIKKMKRPPSVVFVLDAKKESIAVNEAERLGITCIGIVDTNCDPDIVPMPIPGNDDAIRALDLFCRVIADAALDGQMRADKIKADRDEKAKRAAKAAKPKAKEEEKAEEKVEAPADDAGESVADEKTEAVEAEAVEEVAASGDSE